MLAPGQNGGLIGYAYLSALGPAVNSSVYNLAASTQTVQKNWQRLKQNRGYKLMACMQSIDRAWSIHTKGDIGRLKNTIQNFKAPLQRSEDDVIDLRGETHEVVERTRSRIKALEKDAANSQNSIDEKKQLLRKIQKQIDQMKTEINELEAAAQSLDTAATSDEESAGRWRMGGVTLAVLGGLAAPVTVGLTWLVSLVGVAAFHNGEQIDKKAKELRAVAQRKRDSIAEMEARKSNFKRKRSRLQGQLENKKCKLAKVKRYRRTTESVWSNLNLFAKLLDGAYRALLDFEVALQNLSQSADCIRILQDLLTQKSYAYLPPNARRTFDTFRFQMRSIRDFLSQEGLPISPSP